MTAFLSKSKWYWITIILTTVSTIAIFTISENFLILIYLRLVLALLLIMFLPGYAFLKLILLTKPKNFDRLEQISLCVGLSMILSSLVGVILNYTPLGVRLLSITFSLMALTNILTTVAMMLDLDLWRKSDIVNIDRS
jgi:uncharacterized membrane protein